MDMTLIDIESQSTALNSCGGQAPLPSGAVEEERGSAGSDLDKGGKTGQSDANSELAETMKEQGDDVSEDVESDAHVHKRGVCCKLAERRLSVRECVRWTLGYVFQMLHYLERACI